MESCKKGDIEDLEKIQKRATKLVTLVTFLRHRIAVIWLLRHCSTYLQCSTGLNTLYSSVHCIHSTVLDWFLAYLEQRVQYVRFRGCSSTPSMLPCGFHKHPSLDHTTHSTVHRRSHSYDSGTWPAPICRQHADKRVLPSQETQALLDRMSACISDVANWMMSNHLQPNTAKTEALWCQQHLIPSAPSCVCAHDIKPRKYARDLGIYIDSDMSMKTHISWMLPSCFTSLHHIRSILHSVSERVLLFVTAMVLSRLDYGSVTLNGITKRLRDRLQSVLNAAARLVCNSHKYDCISPLLHDLHWLRVPERIKFCLAILVFHCRNQKAPEYLNTWRGRYSGPSRLNCEDICGQHRPRGWSYAKRDSVGDRAFSAAASCLWNSLPVNVIASQSLATFKGHLKTYLFEQSFVH